MIAFLDLLLHVVVSPFKTQARLEAEIILLRHQLNVLRRRVPSPPKLVVADRLLHAAGIGAMDFLIVPTVGFKLLFALVILRHERRRLISLSVTDHPTAEWIARQLTN